METDKPKPDKSPIIIALLEGVIIGLVSGYLMNSNSGKTITHSAPATGESYRVIGTPSDAFLWNTKTGESWTTRGPDTVRDPVEWLPVTKK